MTIYIYIYIYKGELKVFQYFGNKKHDLVALDNIVEVEKVTNDTRLWVAKLAWYSTC